MTDEIPDPVLVAAQASLRLCERECTDLRRRLAESEAGAAVLRAAIEKLAACDSKEEAWSELNRVEFEATRYYTGRDFLAVVRNAVGSCDHRGEMECSHAFEWSPGERNVWNPYDPRCRKCNRSIGEIMLKIAAIAPFLRDNLKL